MKNRFLAGTWLGFVAAVMSGLSLTLASAADSPAGKKPKVAAVEKKATPKLTEAELYSMHCARCHAERYPTERTAAQWKTIMLHMRVRANLPAEQSRSILKYLQENSGR